MWFLEKPLVSAANTTLHRPTRGLDTVQTTLPLLFSCSVEMSDSLLLFQYTFSPSTVILQTITVFRAVTLMKSH